MDVAEELDDARPLADQAALMRHFRPLAVLALSVGIPTASSLAKSGGAFGGASGAHISQQGVTNSNGANSLDRDFGTNRAEDREHRSKTNSNSNGVTAKDRDKGRDRASDRHLH